MDKFLIFGLERSGTTSLINALSVGGNVVHEPFNSGTGEIGGHPLFNRMLRESGYEPERLPERPDDPFGYNRFHFIAAERDRCHDWMGRLYEGFTGVKHVWNTVSMPANLNILAWCRLHGIKLIFQVRENLARSLLSQYLAHQSQVWQLGADFEFQAQWRDHRFEAIDVDAFRRDLRKRGQDKKFYEDLLQDRPHCRVTYEDLFLQDRAGQQAELGRVCAFLSADPADLDADAVEKWIFLKTRRQTPMEVLRRVPNFEDFKNYL